MTKRSFGELESEILGTFEPGKRMTVKDVYQILGEQKTKYNTVMTVMTRLCKKKLLIRERIGLQYEYWLSNPNTRFSSALEQFKKKIFGTKTSQMVSYLIESADDISSEELDEMERLIKNAKVNKS